MIIVDEILGLIKMFHPSGRAFKIPIGSNMEKLHRGLSQSGARAWNDGVSILDSIIPDNSNFTADDATQWERRLGLITNTAVPLADRKLAIIRKMNHPGTIPARSTAAFLEKQLRDAGFDVYVYENRFPDGMGGYETQNPLDLTGGVGAISPQYGDFQYGDQQYGSYYGNLVVNSIDENTDSTFDIGQNLKATFFIGGNPLGTFADVDAERKLEFRQIILKSKQTQMVAYLFINYV